MPYIDKASRDLLNVGLRAVKERIATLGTARPGDMNYAISQLIRMVYGEHPRYADYNEIIGVLECAKLELYRTRAGVYEEQKRVLNGDIYLDKP